MAKNVIEKAPFVYDMLNNALASPKDNYSRIEKLKAEIFNNGVLDVAWYSSNYGMTDKQGNYYYWDSFKYRILEKDDPKKAWFATKEARNKNNKLIDLYDKNNKIFTFCLPDSLDAKLFKIAKQSNEAIDSDNTIYHEYLISSLGEEEAISSAQLEGASTTRMIAKKILGEDRSPKNEDEQMIVNSYRLMKEVKVLKNASLNINMILNLHEIATVNTTQNNVIPGTFRDNNKIVVVDGDGNIIHQPPKYTEIESRLKKLCKFANDNHGGEKGGIFINPIVKAIILHFMIGYEHPFSDGNGRTARAIFYWYMLKSGFSFFEYISISKLLKIAPIQYGKSYLYTEIDDNDLTYFLYYQCDIILRAMQELTSYLREKTKELEDINELLKDSKLINLKFIQKDIIKKAIKTPGRIFTAKEITYEYEISANTARKYLNELVNYKILICGKVGRVVTYIAPANLHDILKKAN
jgi:Fic family protein